MSRTYLKCSTKCIKLIQFISQRNKHVLAYSTWINATVCQPAAANATQLNAMVDPTMTSTKFYLEPGFREGNEVRPKGQLTGATMVQMASSAALQILCNALV